jgi:hypothetical protein
LAKTSQARSVLECASPLALWSPARFVETCVAQQPMVLLVILFV